jgi:hypothetical protein
MFQRPSPAWVHSIHFSTKRNRKRQGIIVIAWNNPDDCLIVVYGVVAKVLC